MPIPPQYLSDAAMILSHRHDNGADYWATPDLRLATGAPFSTLDCASYLSELGMDKDDPIFQETANLIFGALQPDGQFHTQPKGSGFPCQTVHALRVLCRMGYQSDSRLGRTYDYLLSTRYTDGGWRCNKFFFGHGPETEHANPYPTLAALDVFRYIGLNETEPSLDRAVDFLLDHWTTRLPIGPCHYGIGTLFMQVEYPFRNYNLFEYVYVLSFYARARADHRFLEAFEALKARTEGGQIVVQRVVPKLAKLAFCKKGAPSALASVRYREILHRLAAASSPPPSQLESR